MLVMHIQWNNPFKSTIHMKLLLPLLLLISSTLTAQLTATQLTQVQTLIRDSMNAQRARTTILVRDSMNRERAFTRPQISSIITVNNTQNNRLGLGEWRDIRDSATNVTQTAQLATLILQMADVLNILNNRALIPDSSGFTFEGKRFRPKLDSTAAAAIATAIVESFKEKQVRFNTGIDTRVTESEEWNLRVSKWIEKLNLTWESIFKIILPQP